MRAIKPPPTATVMIAGRSRACVRPTVAQYQTIAAPDVTSAHSAGPKGPVLRKARAIAIRIAARPALKRKNFTPASRDTNTSVKAMPTPRWARNRKRIIRAGLPFLPVLPAASAKPLVDLAPVDDVPPCVDVVGTPILILEVVGVFPHVDAEHRLLAVHHRAVLVRAAFDGQRVAGADHPGPPAAEPAHRSLLQLFFELVEAPE